MLLRWEEVRLVAGRGGKRHRSYGGCDQSSVSAQPRRSELEGSELQFAEEKLTSNNTALSALSPSTGSAPIQLQSVMYLPAAEIRAHTQPPGLSSCSTPVCQAEPGVAYLLAAPDATPTGRQSGPHIHVFGPQRCGPNTEQLVLGGLPWRAELA